MINKIERLVSIGKYRNYQAAGQVNFKKLTLIYGDNGGGKTTLTSVMRSLTSNNSEIVRSRISTNTETAQAAQITYINGTTNHHTFHHTNGWSNPLPGIEIFDVHFVHDNVYSGYQVTDDHKKQLHQFVVGAQGIIVQQQIETNKNAKTAIRNRRIEYERQLFTIVENGLVTNLVPVFLTITNEAAINIDALVATAETALLSANANAVIQTLLNLSQINRLQTGINFPNIIADLQSTMETIQNTVLQSLFNDHCQDLSENSLESPDNWLQNGYRYIQTKQIPSIDEFSSNGAQLNCPFCKQELNSDLEIIQAYTLKFNTEFNALVLRLQGYLQQVRDFNIEAAILAINNINELNAARITSWSRHLPNTVIAPTFNIITNEIEFREKYQAVITAIERKIQNPSQAVLITPIVEFQTEGGNINRNIVTYNQEISNYNTAIVTFRASIQSVSDALASLQRQKRIQKRFIPEVAEICTNISNDILTLRTLETEYRTLMTTQEAESAVFFGLYRERINFYLTDVFKTLFRIEDVRSIAPQGRAIQSKLGYNLTIDGQEIAFESGLPFSSKECLSEGDKSTIALAFFLSKLDLETDKTNKILVFDDPLSSLDTNRRTYTVSIIRRLLQEMKQVVVLSHNEYFLHEISRNISAANLATLRITENFVEKASIIEVCDLEQLVKSDYFKQIEALEKFRTQPDHAIKDSVFGWLRTVLEAHLRFKFYREIRVMPGQKTFGSLIGFLDTSGVVFTDNANRVSVITSLHMINNISWMPHHGTPMPDFNNLAYNPTTITASELDNLIVDTLDLINRRL